MKLKIFLAAVTSIGLLGGVALNEARAQSAVILDDYPIVFELWELGKEACEAGDLSNCVGATRDVNQSLETLRDSVGAVDERILLIGTRALTATGFNVAMAVSAVNSGNQAQACILLGNALLHAANAAEVLAFLPDPGWEEEVKEAVASLQADAVTQRVRLRPLVNEACPPGETFF